MSLLSFGSHRGLPCGLAKAPKASVTTAKLWKYLWNEWFYTLQESENALSSFHTPTEQAVGGSRSRQLLLVGCGGDYAHWDRKGHQRAAEAWSSAVLHCLGTRVQENMGGKVYPEMDRHVCPSIRVRQWICMCCVHVWCVQGECACRPCALLAIIVPCSHGIFGQGWGWIPLNGCGVVFFIFPPFTGISVVSLFGCYKMSQRKPLVCILHTVINASYALQIAIDVSTSRNPKSRQVPLTPSHVC